jgi:hypothetical protein
MIRARAREWRGRTIEANVLTGAPIGLLCRKFNKSGICNDVAAAETRLHLAASGGILTAQIVVRGWWS